MDSLEPQIGKLVKEAESRDKVALSYTFTKEMGLPADSGKYSAVSFVNQRWLDLVTKGAPQSAVKPVPYRSIPKGLIQMVREETKLLSRHGFSRESFGQLQFMQPVKGFQLPVAQGGGGQSLHFADDVLVVVVPSIYDAFNDSTLTSMASTSNIVFTGVAATQQLLKNHGLDVRALREHGIHGELHIAYIAEDGILQAQFAANVVRLQSFALIALVVAFTVATVISALITAILRAKHDFPLRLAGQSWARILWNRVVKELLIGTGLAGIVVMLQRPDAMEAVLVIAVYGLLVVPLSHLFATRYCFNGVIRRRI